MAGSVRSIRSASHAAAKPAERGIDGRGLSPYRRPDVGKVGAARVADMNMNGQSGNRLADRAAPIQPIPLRKPRYPH